jgi:hypothetical protein
MPGSFLPYKKRVAMFEASEYSVEKWQEKRNFLLIRELPLDFRNAKINDGACLFG